MKIGDEVRRKKGRDYQLSHSFWPFSAVFLASINFNESAVGTTGEMSQVTLMRDQKIQWGRCLCQLKHQKITQRKTYNWEPSCHIFCHVCRCNFKSYCRGFTRRVSTENLFQIPKRAAALCNWTGFSMQDPIRSYIQCLPTAVERFKQTSVLSHWANSGKVTRTALPGKGTLEMTEKPKQKHMARSCT